MLTVLSAFLIGLLSLIHCFGMCGGIIGALSMSLAPEIRASRSRLALFSLLYSLGRILSYVVAGMIGGLLGKLLVDALQPDTLASGLRIVSALVMILIGLYVGGWFARLAIIEKMGAPVWRYLQPIGQRMLPVRSPWQALVFGLVWGWLPCGLVYSVVVMATLSGSALEGGIMMLAFGLGTLPAIFAGGMLSSWLIRLRDTAYLRPAAGGVLVISGLLVLWTNVYPGSQDNEVGNPIQSHSQGVSR